MPSTKRPTAMVKPFFNTVRRDNELTKRSPTRMKTLERWIPRKPVRNSKIKNQKSPPPLPTWDQWLALHPRRSPTSAKLDTPTPGQYSSRALLGQDCSEPN